MSNKDQIFVELKKIMAAILKTEIKEIDGIANINSKLRDDLGIDSVESLDFLTAIESLYSIHISDAEAKTLRTVSDVIDVISNKK